MISRKKKNIFTALLYIFVWLFPRSFRCW